MVMIQRNLPRLKLVSDTNLVEANAPELELRPFWHSIRSRIPPWLWPTVVARECPILSQAMVAILDLIFKCRIESTGSRNER